MASNDDPKNEDGGEPKPPADPPTDEVTEERLEELKREAIKSRRELRAAQAAADEVRAELERMRLQNESEQEKAVREAVEAAKQEIAAGYELRLVQAQVTARAAGRLRDPGDAVHLIALDPILGERDEDARARRIDEALAELLEAKPYVGLSVDNGEQPRSEPLVTQGPRSPVPSRSGEPSSADAWIRNQARRR